MAVVGKVIGSGGRWQANLSDRPRPRPDPHKNRAGRRPAGPGESYYTSPRRPSVIALSVRFTRDAGGAGERGGDRTATTLCYRPRPANAPASAPAQLPKQTDTTWPRTLTTKTAAPIPIASTVNQAQRGRPAVGAPLGLGRPRRPDHGRPMCVQHAS